MLTTGNKSELSVGYATLYGDMAGGFAVLKDVFKGWSTPWSGGGRARGAGAGAGLRARPPALRRAAPRAARRGLAAGLEVLDTILAGYVEQDLDAAELVAQGLPAEEVERVIRMVDLAEYKRRQAPPGIRISTKAFGRDRRLPITSGYETRIEDSVPKRSLRAL